jgi:hypothetical protein
MPDGNAAGTVVWIILRDGEEYTTAIFGESGMERLVNVTYKVSDKPKCNTLLIAWRIGRAEHLHIPHNRFDDAIAQFTVSLLVVCVGVFRVE